MNTPSEQPARLGNSSQLGWRLTTNYALIQSIFNMSYCCIMSFAAVFLLSRNLSNFEVGLTLTIANGLAIVCQPLISVFADTTRTLTLNQIAACLLLVCFLIALLLMLTPAIVVPTAVLFILLACAFSSQGSLVTGMAIEHINAGVPINFSLARGIGSFTFAVVALILGNLTFTYGGWIVMPVGMGIFLVGILVVLTFPKAPGMAVKNGASSEQAIGFVEFARQNRRFMAFIGSVALLFFSHVLIGSYAIKIIQRVGGTSADLGMSSAIAGFLELPAMALFPLLMRRVQHPGTVLQWSGVFLVLKTLLTLLAPNIGWIYVAQCFQFFAFAMFVPSSVYYVNQVIREADKVKGQAGMSMAISISGMIGNFLGGIMLDSSGGVGFMLTVGLGVSLVGLVLVLMLTEGSNTSSVVS